MPKFGDISSAVNNFLDCPKTSFGSHGVDTVNYKFKTSNGFDIEIEGGSEGGSTNFEQTFKYSTSAGVDLKEQFETAKGVITLEASTKKLAKGSKVVAKAKFASDGFTLNETEVKAEYATGALNFDAAYKSKKNTLDARGVFTKGAFSVGAQTQFDTKSTTPAFKSFDAAFGYAADDFQLTSKVINAKDLELSGHYNQSASTDVYMRTTIPKGGAITTIVGTAYQYDNDTTVEAKLDNSKVMDLAFTHQLRKEIELVLSAQVNLDTKTAGAVGIALNIVA